jgi:hypothetical protein
MKVGWLSFRIGLRITSYFYFSMKLQNISYELTHSNKRSIKELTHEEYISKVHLRYRQIIINHDLVFVNDVIISRSSAVEVSTVLSAYHLAYLASTCNSLPPPFGYKPFISLEDLRTSGICYHNPFTTGIFSSMFGVMNAPILFDVIAFLFGFSLVSS